MSAFQILALGVLACFLVITIVAIVKGAASRRDGFFWILLWLAAGTAFAWPEVTGFVARKLGIGRGADLVLYGAVVVMMIGFLMVYVRLRKLQREVTLLVRHLAIHEAIERNE